MANLQDLFNELVADSRAETPDTFEEFQSKMEDPGYAEKVSKGLSQLGYDVNAYEGLKKKEESTVESAPLSQQESEQPSEVTEPTQEAGTDSVEEAMNINEVDVNQFSQGFEAPKIEMPIAAVGVNPISDNQDQNVVKPIQTPVSETQDDTDHPVSKITNLAKNLKNKLTNHPFMAMSKDIALGTAAFSMDEDEVENTLDTQDTVDTDKDKEPKDKKLKRRDAKQIADETGMEFQDRNSYYNQLGATRIYGIKRNPEKGTVEMIWKNQNDPGSRATLVEVPINGTTDKEWIQNRLSGGIGFDDYNGNDQDWEDLKKATLTVSGYKPIIGGKEAPEDINVNYSSHLEKTKRNPSLNLPVLEFKEGEQKDKTFIEKVVDYTKGKISDVEAAAIKANEYIKEKTKKRQEDIETFRIAQQTVENTSYVTKADDSFRGSPYNSSWTNDILEKYQIPISELLLDGNKEQILNKIEFDYLKDFNPKITTGNVNGLPGQELSPFAEETRDEYAKRFKEAKRAEAERLYGMAKKDAQFHMAELAIMNQIENKNTKFRYEDVERLRKIKNQGLESAEISDYATGYESESGIHGLTNTAEENYSADVNIANAKFARNMIEYANSEYTGYYKSLAGMSAMNLEEKGISNDSKALNGRKKELAGKIEEAKKRNNIPDDTVVKQSVKGAKAVVTEMSAIDKQIEEKTMQYGAMLIEENGKKVFKNEDDLAVGEKLRGEVEVLLQKREEVKLKMNQFKPTLDVMQKYSEETQDAYGELTTIDSELSKFGSDKDVKLLQDLSPTLEMIESYDLNREMSIDPKTGRPYTWVTAGKRLQGDTSGFNVLNTYEDNVEASEKIEAENDTWAESFGKGLWGGTKSMGGGMLLTAEYLTSFVTPGESFLSDDPNTWTAVDNRKAMYGNKTERIGRETVNPAYEEWGAKYIVGSIGSIAPCLVATWASGGGAGLFEIAGAEGLTAALGKTLTSRTTAYFTAQSVGSLTKEFEDAGYDPKTALFAGSILGTTTSWMESLMPELPEFERLAMKSAVKKIIAEGIKKGLSPQQISKQLLNGFWKTTGKSIVNVVNKGIIGEGFVEEGSQFIVEQGVMTAAGVRESEIIDPKTGGFGSTTKEYFKNVALGGIMGTLVSGGSVLKTLIQEKSTNLVGKQSQLTIATDFDYFVNQAMAEDDKFKDSKTYAQIKNIKDRYDEMASNPKFQEFDDVAKGEILNANIGLTEMMNADKSLQAKGVTDIKLQENIKDTQESLNKLFEVSQERVDQRNELNAQLKELGVNKFQVGPDGKLTGLEFDEYTTTEEQTENTPKIVELIEKTNTKTQENAIQEPSTGEVLQRQPQETGEAGSERKGVEPVLEGKDTTQEVRKEEIVTPEGFTNRVFENNVQLGEAPTDAHISEEGYNYRVLSQQEIDAIRESGGVFAREGKQKGGNKNTKYWTKGNKKNWFGDKSNSETIRVNQQNFKKNQVVRAEDVEVYNKETKQFEPLIPKSSAKTESKTTTQEVGKEEIVATPKEQKEPEAMQNDIDQVQQSTGTVINLNEDGTLTINAPARGGQSKKEAAIENAKQELTNLGYNVGSRITPAPTISPTSSKDIEAKKADIERKINSLPDNLLFITHITSGGNAINIYNDNLLMPAGVSSTTGIVTKEQLKQILFDLAEGKSPHRGYLDMFIAAIDRSTLENTVGKSLQDKLENYLDENFIEDAAKTQLPSSLNIGYFTDGILNTKYDAELAALEDESTPQFQKNKETVQDSTETIVDEMNKMGGVNIEVDVNEGLRDKGKLNIKSFLNRVGIMLKPKEVKLSDFAGKPIMVTISDELTTGEIINPITGEKINNLKGGLGFNYSEGNEGHAWAYTNEKVAMDVLNVAKQMYAANPSLYPDGIVPVAVVKMGKSAMISNEAVVRQVIQNLKTSKIPSKNKKEAFKLLSQDIKAQVQVVKERIDKAQSQDKQANQADANLLKGYSDILDLISKSKTFDEVVNKITDLNIGVRPLLISRITSGSADLIPKDNALSADKPVAKALMNGLPKAEYKRIHLGHLVSNITEPALKEVPDKHIMAFVGIDARAETPIKSDTHPNYPYVLKGKGLGILSETVHIANAIPAAYGNIVGKLIAAEQKGGRVSQNEAVSRALPAALNNAIFRNKPISEIDENVSRLIGFLQLSFPNTQFFTDKESWKDIMNSDGVKKYLKKGDVVYGLTMDGKIYLNPNFSNFNTPIHETGHLWVDMIEESSPELFQKGLELVEGSKELASAIKTYGDNVQARKEALAMLIGNRGETLTNAAQKSKFKEWLLALWKYVQSSFPSLRDMNPSEVENLTLEQFVNGALRDILGAKELETQKASEKRAKKETKPQFQINQSQLSEEESNIAEQVAGNAKSIMDTTGVSQAEAVKQAVLEITNGDQEAADRYLKQSGIKELLNNKIKQIKAKTERELEAQSPEVTISERKLLTDRVKAEVKAALEGRKEGKKEGVDQAKEQAQKTIDALNKKLEDGKITKQELQDRIKELGYNIRFESGVARLAGEKTGKSMGKKFGEFVGYFKGLKAGRTEQRGLGALVSDYIKDVVDNEFGKKGTVSPATLKSIARRAATISNQKQLDAFISYLDKVIANKRLAEGLNEIKKLQKQLLNKVGYQYTSNMKMFAKFDMFTADGDLAFDMDTMTEYLDALRDLTSDRVPKIGKMMNLFDEMYDINQQNQPNDIDIADTMDKWKTSIDKLFNNTDINDFEDYKKFKREVGKYMRALNTLLDTGAISEADYESAKNKVIEDSAATDTYASEFQDQIDELKTMLIDGVTDKSGYGLMDSIKDWLSNSPNTFTENQKKLIDQLMRAKPNNLMTLSLEDLDLLNQVTAQIAEAGFVDEKNLRTLLDRAEIRGNEVGKSLVEQSQKVRNKYSNPKNGYVKMMRDTLGKSVVFWESRLGMKENGAFRKHLIDPIVRAINGWEKDTQRILKNYQKKVESLRSRNILKNAPGIGKLVNRTKIEKFKLTTDGTLVPNGTIKVSKDAYDRVMIGVIGHVLDNAWNAKQKKKTVNDWLGKQMLSAEERNKMQNEDVNELDIVNNVYNDLKEMFPDGKGGLDHMAVLEAFESDPTSILTSSQLEYYNVVRSTLQEAGEYINSASGMRNQQHELNPYYMPRQAIGTGKAVLTSTDISYNKNVGTAIRSGASYQRVLQVPVEAIRYNVDRLVMTNVNEGLRDYYLTEAKRYVKEVFSNARENASSDEVVMLNNLKQLSDTIAPFALEKSESTIGLSKLMGKFFVDALIGIVRTPVELTTNLIAYAVGNRSSRSLTLPFSPKEKQETDKLLSEFDSSVQFTGLEKKVKLRGDKGIDGYLDRESNFGLINKFLNNVTGFMRKGEWKSQFEREFERNTGEKFNYEKHFVKEKGKYYDEMSKAASDADFRMRRIMKGGNKAEQRQFIEWLPLVKKARISADSKAAPFVGMFSGFINHDADNFFSGLRKTVTRGEIKDGLTQSLGAYSRLALYPVLMVIGKAMVNLNLGDDDEKEEAEETLNSLKTAEGWADLALFSAKQVGATLVGAKYAAGGKVIGNLLLDAAYTLSEDRRQRRLIEDTMRELYFVDPIDFYDLPSEKDDIALQISANLEPIIGMLVDTAADFVKDARDKGREQVTLYDLYEWTQQTEEGKQWMYMANSLATLGQTLTVALTPGAIPFIDDYVRWAEDKLSVEKIDPRTEYTLPTGKVIDMQSLLLNNDNQLDTDIQGISNKEKDRYKEIATEKFKNSIDKVKGIAEDEVRYEKLKYLAEKAKYETAKELGYDYQRWDSFEENFVADEPVWDVEKITSYSLYEDIMKGKQMSYVQNIKDKRRAEDFLFKSLDENPDFKQKYKDGTDGGKKGVRDYYKALYIFDKYKLPAMTKPKKSDFFIEERGQIKAHPNRSKYEEKD